MATKTKRPMTIADEIAAAEATPQAKATAAARAASRAAHEAAIANLTPNAYVVIAFTTRGPELVGTYATEAKARAIYDALEHAYLSAQVQTRRPDRSLDSQTTIWGEHK